ncbi:hypothetical protein Tco_1557636 [Tanacetum coccineum]
MAHKFKSKLADSKAEMISFGGRLTFVKSVLDSLSLYFFSLFRAPLSVLHSLESVRRDFLAKDGLGIQNIWFGLIRKRHCLVMGWEVENEALWVKVGDGKAILFWDDIVGGMVEGNKGAWREDDWVWEWRWRITPRGRVLRDITKLSNLVQSVHLKKHVMDKCRWKISEDEKFSVKVLRDLIDEKTLGSTGR